MKPELGELGTNIRPRLTAEPRRSSDYLDYDHYEKTGEERYIETIDDENCVDPFDEGLAPEAYWAEGWNFGSNFRAYRNDTYEYNDAPCRMFPTRYRLADFNLSRSFRRVLKNNADLKCVVRPLRMTPAKDALDQLHCYSRFRVNTAPLSSNGNRTLHCVAQRELTVFHPTGALIAFSIIEIGDNASYAVRTAWAPDEKHRSLGTFTFLKAAEYAQSLGFEHHYVGPTIVSDPVYNYKLRFPACEVYDWDANDWVRSESERAEKMFAAPIPHRRWDTEKQDWAK